jgi:hypothetical protein
MASSWKPIVRLLAVATVSVAIDSALTRASAQSPHRFLLRTTLELHAPEVSAPLLSQLPASLMIPYRYTGHRTLAFTLVQGPAGMTVDETSGLVEWTPPFSAEGSETDVHLRATDGVLTDEVEFTITVAATQPLAVSWAGSTATITTPGTLAGVSFSFPAGASPSPAFGAAGRSSFPTGVTVSRVATAGELPLPEGFTRVSDFFRLSPVTSPSAPIVITAPARRVPAGCLPERLRLMVHSTTALDLPGVEPLWLATWTGLDVLPGGDVTLEANAVGELSCFAVGAYDGGAAPIASTAARTESGRSSDHLAGAATCTPLRLSNGAVDATRQVCTVSGEPTLTVVVRTLARNNWLQPPTAEELAGWLATAREALGPLHMLADTRVEVGVEPLGWYGPLACVSRSEGYRVLHLNAEPSPRPGKEAMQAAVVHAYFHHAQSRTALAGLSNLVWDYNPRVRWVVEGTARWFEDEVLDDLNSYRLSEGLTLPAILAAGLDSVPSLPWAPDQQTRASARFAFFKLVSSRCADMDLSLALNTVSSSDPTGLAALQTDLSLWGCTFATGLSGVDGDSLGAALLEYAYAAARQDMAWLDANEPPAAFEDLTESLHADKSCTAAGSCPPSAGRVAHVPRAGVRSFRVEPVDPIPGGTGALIQLRATGGTAMAWIGNDGSGGFTLGNGHWLTTSGTVSHLYGSGARAPSMLVLLVNESTLYPAEVDVRARLYSTSPADVVTPFSFAWSYAPADPIREKNLKNYVTWDASVDGSVTAPETATVTPVAPAFGWANSKAMRVCAGNAAAFTLRMEATLQATTGQSSGRIAHPTLPQAWLNWQYSNPHLKIWLNDPSGTISGSTVSFTISVVKGAWFSRTYGACVAYRLETWATDKDGKDGTHSVAEDECQGALELDLRVGAPPDGCAP